MTEKDKRPVLVQIHALGADHAMWAASEARLGGAVRALSPDLFGIGATPRAPAPPSATDHAAHLLPMVQALDAPVVMSGCAVGAMIATELASRLGDQLAGLILANPILRITEPAGAVLLERAARARTGGIEAVEDEILSRAFAGLDDPAPRESFRQRLLAIRGAAYADLAEGICGADISDALRRLTCPILLAPGGRDQILPAWHVEEIVALTPRAQVQQAPSGGHFMPHQTPAEYAAIVADFLNALT